MTNPLLLEIAKPLEERDWKFGEHTGIAIKERGGLKPLIGSDKAHGLALQALEDQPRLIAEVERLQQKYEELEQVGMPLNKFEALCADVRNDALEEAAKIVEREVNAWATDGDMLVGYKNSGERIVRSIRQLSAPASGDGK